MARNHEVRIKLGTEEYERLKRKADVSGISISTYLRIVGLKSELIIQ